MRHIDPYTDTWVAHRARRVQVRTATKNQLMGQLDRSFPGLSTALADVLGSKGFDNR